MLNRFIGMTNQSLDVKNRFAVPSKFRIGDYREAEVLYMLVVFGKFPHIDFFFNENDLNEEIKERRSRLSPNTPPETADFMFNGCLDVLTLDKQGRSNAINSRYLRDARLNKDMVIVGNGRYFSAYDIYVYDEFSKLATDISESRHNAYIEATYADDRRLARGDEKPEDDEQNV